MNIRTTSFLPFYEQDLAQSDPVKHAGEKKRKREGEPSKKIETLRSVKLFRACPLFSDAPNPLPSPSQEHSKLDSLAQVASEALEKESREKKEVSSGQSLQKTSGSFSLDQSSARKGDLSSALFAQPSLSQKENSIPSPQEEASDCSLSFSGALPLTEDGSAAARNGSLSDELLAALRSSFNSQNPITTNNTWNKTNRKQISKEDFLKIKQEGLLFKKQKKAAEKIGISAPNLSKLWRFCQKNFKEGSLPEQKARIIYPWPRRFKKEIENLPYSLCTAIWNKLYGRSSELVKEDNLVNLKKELIKELETMSLEKLSLVTKEAKTASEELLANKRPQPVNFSRFCFPNPFKKDLIEQTASQNEKFKKIEFLYWLNKSQKEVAKELDLAPCQLSKRWTSCLKRSRYREFKLSWGDWKKESIDQLSLPVCCAIWRKCYGSKNPMTKAGAESLKQELFEEFKSVFREILDQSMTNSTRL